MVGQLDPIVVTPDHCDPPGHAEAPTAAVGLRRFTITVLVALGIVTVPFLWILWDSWSGVLDPVRHLSEGDFYDVQARAMLSGHLHVPPGSLGVEAFLHNGRQYAYFGLFPSLLRLPVLVLTHSLDGKLTAPSILAAWMVAAIVIPLLLWRVRIMMRGKVMIGWVEAACCGLLVAAITGGSVLMFLAATPRPFQEELAWSVALTIASLFALLGVLEWPTRGRVVACGLVIMASSLTRGSTGYACVLGALLVAVWFGTGRGGDANRKWTIPMMAVGFVPLIVMVALNDVKFGQLFGFSEANQVWSHVSVQRRHFLASNGGSGFGLQFLPSTLTAYLRPGGLHLGALFPYVSLPAVPGPIIGHVVFDETDPTTSIPASMPLLLACGVWGVITAFRPRSTGRARLIRVPLTAAAAGCVGVLVFGYIANRYLGDFLPFLALASMVGLVDICRRVERARRPAGTVVVAAIAALALFGVWANTAIAMMPTPDWTSGQARAFVSAQHDLSGQALAAHTLHRSTLPTVAAAGTVVDVGSCRGLYLSTGFPAVLAPAWLAQHTTWVAVEQGSGINRVLDVGFNRPLGRNDPSVTLLTYGQSTLLLQQTGADSVRIILDHPAKPLTWPPPVSGLIVVRPHVHYQLQVMVDPILNRIEVTGLGASIVPSTAGPGNLAVDETGPGSGQSGPVTVTDVTRPAQPMSLCRALARTP